MKKNSTKPQDDYELNDEYDLSKMSILPKGRFNPNHSFTLNPAFWLDRPVFVFRRNRAGRQLARQQAA